METKDILIVDDEEIIIGAVIKICKSEHLSVGAATDSLQALNMLEKQNYKLILCDIMMPDMDGFSFLDELYKRKINTPVIMITGYSTVQNAVKSLHKGAIDFIPKPFTFEELLSSISRGLKFSKIRKEIIESKNYEKAELRPIFYVPCPPKYLKLGFTSWMYLENEGAAVIGATDLFLRTIDSVKSIKMMDIDDVFYQGNSCVQFQSDDDLLHNFLAPLGGKIIERNERLIENISLLEKDPYFEGWIYRIIPADVEYDMKYLVPCSSERI